MLLFEVSDLPPGAAVEATITVDDQPLPGWERRSVALTGHARQRLELLPERDLADVDLGFTGGFMRTARVEVHVLTDGAIAAGDETSLDVCDVRNLGSLYKRVIDRLVRPDTSRQAAAAGFRTPVSPITRGTRC